MWICVSGQSHGQLKGGYKQVRDQISDVSHLTLDTCHLSSPHP